MHVDERGSTVRQRFAPPTRVERRRSTRPEAASPGRLLGRDRELASMRRMLDFTADPTGTALVLRGEAGVGKSALLDACVALAPPEVLVLRTEGVESESGIGHAGLHRLLYGVLSSHASVPPLPRAAMHTAFGLGDGPPPDRFHIGLATVAVLAEASRTRPVLCVVDDAHWLDKESLEALGFMARRLPAHVAVVFAASDDASLDALHGLPSLHLWGLEPGAASELLGALYPEPIDRVVATKVVSDLGGNPSALRGLATTCRDVDRLTRCAVEPGPMPTGERIERRYGERIAALPAETTVLLLVAAADPRLEPQVLRKAAEQLGIGVESIDDAEAAAVVEIDGDAIVFPHPLVRSASYWSASPTARRRAHALLAELVDPQRDLERHAWHLALSTSEPDERIASVLASAAGVAGGRGARHSQVELLLRSAELSTDAAARCRRHLRATTAAGMAADHGRLTRLIERARASTTDPHMLAEVGRIHALEPAFRGRYGSSAQQLAQAALALDRFDRGRARDVASEALSMFGIADPCADGLARRDLARIIRAMPREERGAGPSVVDLLLDGYADVILDGWAAGAPSLQEAMRRWPSDADLGDTAPHHLGPPSWAAFALWEYDRMRGPASNGNHARRAASALDPVRFELVRRARLEVAAGQYARAEVTASEISHLSVGEVGHEGWHVLARAEMLAWRGRAEETNEAIRALRSLAREQQVGYADQMAHLAAAVLANGSRMYADAAIAARFVAGNPVSEFGSQALVELAEALAHLDDRAELESVLAEINVRAGAGASTLARGMAARAHASAATGGEADDLFRQSIELLSETTCAPDLARAHLAYGEWLRRERRPTDARHHLREAHGRLVEMGARSFAARARAELQAAGEQEPRHGRASTHLTAQERQVATLASQGQTNKEIATQLFLSASTIDFHLRKVYRKLGISSRRQLARSGLELPRSGPE